jgi:putative radical SAM enzyme (TIGR03279 family)
VFDLGGVCLKQHQIIIESVLAGSIAEETGIEKGDIILSVNGEKIKDVFDYRFLITNEELLLEIQKPDGEIWEIEIEKDEYEDLGVEFETSMMDDAKSCTNNCVFCFIDQLPEGMRETMYFKDDDSRLSFLTGNYVTLTNIKTDDVDRIIKYKMSPINVSVHTTNPELRIAMLKNRFAGDIMKMIKKLVDGGITLNCQIVLCRGINDREELSKSIYDLVSFYPGIRSVSVVPVGLTKHREGLYYLKPFDKESSTEVVKQVKAIQEELLKKLGSRVVYLADEFYIMAELDMPEFAEYEDFPQIENGVGLISLFMHEFKECMKALTRKPSVKAREISIATGRSPYKFIKDMADALEKRFEGLKINVFEIKNDFFGENVTVTGLLTGQDIVKNLKGKHLGDELLISRSMLKSGEDILLDDYSVGMLEDELGLKVTVVENDGANFIEKILDIVV